MANIRRRLFAGLTILSLVLCMGIIALWVRGYWWFDVLRWGRAEALQSFGMQSSFGELGFFVSRFPPNFPEPTGLSTIVASPPNRFRDFAKVWTRERGFTVLGFGLGYFDLGAAPRQWIAAIWFPHWFGALIFAVAPAVRLRLILRARRQDRAGRCPRCGYDLRATPDRCPECGQVPPPRAQVAPDRGGSGSSSATSAKAHG